MHERCHGTLVDSVGEVDDPVSMLGRPRFTGSRFATIDDHADAPIATPGGVAVVDQVADLHVASTGTFASPHAKHTLPSALPMMTLRAGKPAAMALVASKQ